MALGLIFWILMLLSLLGGLALGWQAGPGVGRWSAGLGLFWWLALMILGWAQFGAPIKT